MAEIEPPLKVLIVTTKNCHKKTKQKRRNNKQNKKGIVIVKNATKNRKGEKNQNKKQTYSYDHKSLLEKSNTK